MSQETEQNQTLPPVPAPTAGGTDEATTPPVKPQEKSSKSYSQEELDAILAKARADEKATAYSKIDKLKAEKIELQQKTKALEEKEAELTADLDSVRTGKTTELDSITKEIASLRDKNTKLEMAMKKAAEDAALQVRETKLAAYREKRIAAEGLVLPELVNGDTEQEIDESIAKAKEREEDLKKRFTAPPKDSSATLPTPLSPDGSQGRSQGQVVTSQNIRDLASLPKDQYAVARKAALQLAKEKSGLA